MAGSKLFPFHNFSTVDTCGNLMNSRQFVSGLLLFILLVGESGAQVQIPGASASDGLFDPGRVIEIEIRLDAKEWHALRISHPDLDEDLVPIRMNYNYYRADVVIDGKAVKSVGVRKKGTWGSTARPSLKIKLDEYVKGQEFSGLEMLTLNNFAYSPTKAHQSLVYSLMRKAGAIAPRSNLVRVIVNGEDLGIYGQVESIDKRFIKRHLGNARGDLYEGWYGADFTTNGYKKIEHKFGKDGDLAHVRKLMEVLETPGPISLKSIEAHVDLNAFLTFWAAEVLIGQADGYPYNASNYYVYRDAESGRFFFIPWGADVAFDFTYPPEAPTSVWAGGHLCRRLWEIPEVRERYRREMRRLLAEVWDEKAMTGDLNVMRRFCQVDRPQDVVRGDKVAAGLAGQIENRRSKVQAELDAPAPDWTLPRREPKPLSPVDTKNPPTVIEGSFTAEIAEAFPTNAAGYFGQGTAALQFTITNSVQQPFARFGAIAVLGKNLSDGNAIRIVAANSAGDLRWELRFDMDSYRAPLTTGARRLGLEEWSVRAPVIQYREARGSRKMQVRDWSQNKGTLDLTQVSTNLDGTISGKFKINTTAFEEERKP